MAWIEGLSSSNRLLQDLAKIVTQANKTVKGEIDKPRNWELVYPRPYNLTDVKGETLTVQANTKEYKATQGNWFVHRTPKVYLTTGTTTALVEEDKYTVDFENGTIIFGEDQTGTITADFTFVKDESLETGIGKIGPHGRIILKTHTTPVTPDTTIDPFNTDPDLKVSELTMYLEIEKPELLINPESGQIGSRFDGSGPIENHYHLNVRMFDRYDYDKQIPVEKIVDPITGLTVDEGAHVSEWSKYSWYSDFKEYLVDELDDVPGTDDISKGITYTHVETPGLHGQVPIQYWISTNNDRIAMVLMGEPSINYDNYITSFMYAGKIDSFEGSKNDTAGNFALTVGSSSIPCEANPNPDPITENTLFQAEPIQTPITGSGSYESWTHSVSYKVVAENDFGEALATDAQLVSYLYRDGTSINNRGSNTTTNYSNFRLTFSHIPANAKRLRIYRRNVSVHPSASTTNWFLENTIEVTGSTMTYLGQSSIDMTKPVPVTNIDLSEVGVVRDQLTGAVISVKFPRTWGVNTATGVNDISMYKTRSGVYYQRHMASFITPEEFMKKDAFNPSRWTNKFHLSPLYVVHGYDGYRGFFKDVVVVDDSSIVHLDELIVDKGMANEEIYKYFKLSAPFSLMQNSANANYGIAIKKV